MAACRETQRDSLAIVVSPSFSLPLFLSFSVFYALYCSGQLFGRPRIYLKHKFQLICFLIFFRSYLPSISGSYGNLRCIHLPAWCEIYAHAFYACNAFEQTPINLPTWQVKHLCKIANDRFLPWWQRRRYLFHYWHSRRLHPKLQPVNTTLFEANFQTKQNKNKNPVTDVVYEDSDKVKLKLVCIFFIFTRSRSSCYLFFFFNCFPIALSCLCKLPNPSRLISCSAKRTGLQGDPIALLYSAFFVYLSALTSDTTFT